MKQRNTESKELTLYLKHHGGWTLNTFENIQGSGIINTVDNNTTTGAVR